MSILLGKTSCRPWYGTCWVLSCGEEGGLQPPTLQTALLQLGGNRGTCNGVPHLLQRPFSALLPPCSSPLIPPSPAAGYRVLRASVPRAAAAMRAGGRAGLCDQYEQVWKSVETPINVKYEVVFVPRVHTLTTYLVCCKRA